MEASEDHTNLTEEETVDFGVRVPASGSILVGAWNNSTELFEPDEFHRLVYDIEMDEATKTPQWVMTTPAFRISRDDAQVDIETPLHFAMYGLPKEFPDEIPWQVGPDSSLPIDGLGFILLTDGPLNVTVLIELKNETRIPVSPEAINVEAASFAVHNILPSVDTPGSVSYGSFTHPEAGAEYFVIGAKHLAAKPHAASHYRVTYPDGAHHGWITIVPPGASSLGQYGTISVIAREYCKPPGEFTYAVASQHSLGQLVPTHVSIAGSPFEYLGAEPCV